MSKNNITLREGQQRALLRLLDFVRSSQKRVFILKGYAGTGKTTLIKSLIGELKKFNTPYHMVASTGRAAKIMNNITGNATTTVHGLIYKYSDFNQDLETIVEDREKTGTDKSGQLMLKFEITKANNTNTAHIYIVDEASMISDVPDKTSSQAMFGSGRLLHDLLEYDVNGKFVFVGDTCQLPPISQKTSPALTGTYLKSTFNISAEEAELTEIIRQNKDNDIVLAAQKLRKLYFNPQPWKWAKFPLKDCKNIRMLGSQAELIQLYIKDLKAHGYNASTLICTTNRQCDILTNIIRPALGINKLTLATDDLLLVTQNNCISGLMNGDLVKITEIGDTVIRRAGLTFLTVSVTELFTNKAYSQLIITDIIYSNQINLSQEQQKELFIDFYIRMKKEGIKQNSDTFRSRMMSDPYLNALRCVYGYAITCHKSQGGEWNNVYLDIPRNFALQPKPFVYQWMYTAITRAKKNLFVVDDFYIM